MIIFLIGFMGSGKTTLGKQLASKLGYRFIDQDEVIEQKYQMTVSEIFAKQGEDEFRKAENEVLQELIKRESCVIATGGGAPCFHNNMELMNESGFTIYIKVDPEIIVQRLKVAHTSRPLMMDKSEAEMLEYTQQKISERSPFYSRSKLILYSKNLTVDDILRALEDMELKA
jgi:shikimate kinase